MKRLALFIAGTATLALVLVVAFGRGGNDDHAADDAIHVHARQLRFEPSDLRVKVGETVRLRLDNHDSSLHDYTVAEARFVVLSAGGAEHGGHDPISIGKTGEDVKASLAPLHIAADGKKYADIVFQAVEAGEYEFYCTVPGHRESGMRGKIIVEGA